MGPSTTIDDTGLADAVWAAPVPAPLVGIVSSVIGYQQTGGSPRLHRGMPSGSMTIIVNVGDAVRVRSGVGGTAGQHTFDTTIAGLHTAPALIEDPGTQIGVSIGLHPAGVRALLAAPAAALAGEAVELDDMFGPDGRHLWEAVQEPGSVADRTLRCLAWLTARLDDRPAVIAPEVRRAWSVLEASDGRARIDDVAADVGWSRQHLRRRFRAEFGLNPKETARILRFHATVQRLRDRPDGSLSAIAVDCGYADQAHLSNEWAQLAGCSPTTWIATELVPNVQDGDEIPSGD
ncbi:MAG: AraC family transcriptional regulator [Actinomycetota bacterium]